MFVSPWTGAGVCPETISITLPAVPVCSHAQQGIASSALDSVPTGSVEK